MTDEQINAAIFEAIKQRDQAREQLEFIDALKKENEELMEQVGSLMFMAEIMQNEINKLQK